MPSGAIAAVKEIRRHAVRCKKCRERAAGLEGAFRDHAQILGARTCRPELFKRYQKERRQSRLPRIMDWGPSWRAACVAAVASAALKTTDPSAAFAAARFLEYQEIVTYLRRILPRQERDAASRALARYEEAVRQRQRRGGLAKRGKLRPYWELIRRCLAYDAGMAEQFIPWVRNPPRQRSREDVLRMLEDSDLLGELASGGAGGAHLSLRVTVDRDASTVEFLDVDDSTNVVSFQALSSKIGRLRKVQI